MPSPRTGSRASTPTAPSVALKERVLDTAAELFARKSFAGTTTEEVADAVGELRGTVYYHFENKQGILEGIQDRLTDELVERLTQARDQGSTPVDRVERMIAALTDFAIARPNDFATSLEDLKYLSPKARKRFESRLDEVRGLLAEAIEEALVGAQRRNVDSRVAAASIVYTLATMYRWYRPRGRLSRDAVIEQVSGLLLRGLAQR